MVRLSKFRSVLNPSRVALCVYSRTGGATPEQGVMPAFYPPCPRWVRESGNDSHGFRAMARTLLDKGPRFRLERIEQQLACRGSDPLRRPLFLYNQDSLAALSDLLGRCYKT